MRISELAEKVGVTTDTIRFYEKQGLLDRTLYKRGENNYRDYSEGALERLAVIARAKGLGFSLSEIARLWAQWDSGALDRAAKVRVLHEKLAELGKKRRELEALEAVIREKLGKLGAAD